MKFDVLHNFISPVTGRVLSTPNYVLVGDGGGIATPSPILIDIRLDLINLRQHFKEAVSASFIIGFSNPELPNAQVLSNLSTGYMFNTDGIVSINSAIPVGDLLLPEGEVFVGDSTGHAAAVPTISINNLPDLTEGSLWIGGVGNRPGGHFRININNLPNLGSTIFPDPLGGFIGKIWEGTSPYNKPEESSRLGPIVIDIGAINFRFLAANFIMGFGNPLLQTAMPASQFLSNLGLPGILKHEGLGRIGLAVPGIDYVNEEQLQGEIAGVEAEIQTEVAAAVTTLEAELAAAVTALEIEFGLALGATIIGFGAALLGIGVSISDVRKEIDKKIKDLRLNTILADGDVSIYGFKIINLADPINPQDAATKHYVDEEITGATITLTGSVHGMGNVNGVILTFLSSVQDLGFSYIQFNYSGDIGFVYGFQHKIPTDLSTWANVVTDNTGHLIWQEVYNPSSGVFQLVFSDTGDTSYTTTPLSIDSLGGNSLITVDAVIDMTTNRIENLQQSPEGDFDAISMTFLWDLMHDRVEILWP